TPPGPSRGILLFNQNGTLDRTHATAFNAILGVQPQAAGSTDQQWAAGQGLPSFVYQTMDVANYGDPTDTSVGVSYNEAVANGWLIRDGSGNPISEVAWGYPMLYLADIGNPAYVDAFAKRALATCQAYGNTGVYLDSLNIAQPRTATGRYWPGGSGA